MRLRNTFPCRGKARVTLPKSLSRMLIWAFPHAGKAFSTHQKRHSAHASLIISCYSKHYKTAPKLAYSETKRLSSQSMRFSATSRSTLTHLFSTLSHPLTFSLLQLSSSGPRQPKNCLPSVRICPERRAWCSSPHPKARTCCAAEQCLRRLILRLSPLHV